jgi:DNA polymerase zeta
MIAYNYCYSTCLGRAVGREGENKMGVIDYRRPQGLLGLVADNINSL